MNKIIKFLVLGGVLFSLPTVSFGREKDSYGDPNYMYVPHNIIVDDTGYGKLEIWLDNVTDNFNSFQLDLYLPEGFTLNRNGRAYDIAANNGNELDSKTYDHAVTVSEKDGYYMIVAYSMSLTTIYPDNNLLLTVGVKAPDDYDKNSVLYGRMENVKIAAGGTGASAHVFPDIDFIVGNPVELTIASGDEEIWDIEWTAEDASLPVVFLNDGEDFTSQISDSEFSLEFKPLFNSTQEYEEGVDSGYEEISSYDYSEGDVLVAFPCSGLYEVWLYFEGKANYAINGERAVLIKNANIYPSIKDLSLTYIAVGDSEGYGKDEKIHFEPVGPILDYHFEAYDDDPVGEYKENSKYPFVEGLAEGTEVWYKLHGLDDMDKVEDTPLRVTTDPSSIPGYLQAGDDNQISLDKLAQADYNTNADLSFILKKNGASTPIMEKTEGNDVKSVQFVTLVKGNNVATSVGTIGEDDNEAEYYTLQGIKVVNPESGIYIRIKDKASKVIIK